MNWPRKGNVIFADFGRDSRAGQARDSLSVPREAKHTPAAQRFFDAGTRGADYGRLQRGLKNGGLELAADPTLTNGRVEAQVLGSRGAVYQVRASLPFRSAHAISEFLVQITTSLESLQAAGRGELTEDAVNTLLGEETEIIFNCSCPDSNNRCKHIIHFSEAFAKKIDSDPSIPFKLRGIDLSQLEQTAATGLQGTRNSDRSWNAESYWNGLDLPALPTPKKASALESSNINLLFSALYTVSRGRADTQRAVREITEMYEVLLGARANIIPESHNPSATE